MLVFPLLLLSSSIWQSLDCQAGNTSELGIRSMGFRMHLRPMRSVMQKGADRLRQETSGVASTHCFGELTTPAATGLLQLLAIFCIPDPHCELVFGFDFVVVLDEDQACDIVEITQTFLQEILFKDVR